MLSERTIKLRYLLSLSEKVSCHCKRNPSALFYLYVHLWKVVYFVTSFFLFVKSWCAIP